MRIEKPYYFYTPIENDISLKEIFQLAERGDWGNVFREVENNPDLLNAESDDGATILLLAAIQLFMPNHREEAFLFINRAFTLSKNTNFFLNVNASCEGMSIFWILLANIGNDALQGEWNKFHLIFYCLSHFNCNVNSAPKKGPYEGVTAYSMIALDLELIAHPGIYFQTIYNSKPLPMPAGAHVGPLMTVPNTLILVILGIESNPNDYKERIIKHEKKSFSAEEVLNNCYQSVMKIIKDPAYEVNALCYTPMDQCYKPLVEVVLSLKSSPNRDMLLSYLILAGAELSDTAKPEWKCEYEAIQKGLKAVYQRSLEVLLYEPNRHLFPKELIFEIAHNIILSEIPDFDVIPNTYVRNCCKHFQSLRHV